MNRSMCGGFLLAAATGMLACSGDPTGDLVGAGAAISAIPSSLFMAQGETKPVTVSVLDEQGNALEITGFEAAPGSAAVGVVDDSTYLATSAGELSTSRRVNVTGEAPAATTVAITANGTTLNVPVRVTPTSTPATLSTPTPAANEPLVIALTTPGYKFGSAAGANVEGVAGVVQSVAPDSSSVSVLLPPGTTGTVTVDGVVVDFAPGVDFTLPTDQTVTVGPATPLAGTGSTSTAPPITIQPPGGTTLFFDGGTFDYQAPILGGAFGTFPSRLYSITVADTTTLTTTVDWPSPEDLGIYFFQSNGTTEVGSPGDAGGGGVHPEGTTNTFPPGTYLMAIVNFNATNPAYFSLSITTEVPE